MGKRRKYYNNHQKKNSNTSTPSIVGRPDNDTVIVTSTQKNIQNSINRAIASYDPENRMFSAYLDLSGSATELTQDTILSLGENAQSNLDSIVQLNAIVRKYINTDDLIGMVEQSIANNINTEYTLTWKNFGEQRNKTKTLEKAKAIIEDFNSQIDIRRRIREAIVLTYDEGNYNCLLRNNGENWTVEYLPLGICEVSGYNDNTRPILLVNMQELKSALQKTMIKDRSGKPLFFDNTEEEIKNTYPKEVYDALVNRATYARLDADYTGTCRINNRGRKYGLSPIVRALTSALMLNNFYVADNITAKAKSKKIIHQILRKEVLGNNCSRTGIEEMAYAHSQLMQSWKNPTVVYTSAPSVEKIVYVEPQTEEISTEKVQLYRNKVLSSLGVSFLTNDNSQTASTANISLKQLLQCINSIGEQVERMLYNFYRTVLTVNGIDLIYCPTIKIIDSEMLENDMKISMAQFLYGTLNCSRETAFGVVGVDIEDERHKRERENDSNFDEIFTAHSTAYTKSEKQETRTTENEEKQAYDEEYNKTRN